MIERLKLDERVLIKLILPLCMRSNFTNPVPNGELFRMYEVSIFWQDNPNFLSCFSHLFFNKCQCTFGFRFSKGKITPVCHRPESRLNVCHNVLELCLEGECASIHMCKGREGECCHRLLFMPVFEIVSLPPPESS